MTISSAWSVAARLRRRFGRPPFGSIHEQWIRQNVPGRSFADIGGLFGIEGDIAFLAEEAGATAVTEFDVGDPDLCRFAEKRDARGSSVRFVQGSLEDPASVEAIGPHDVVWCVGVLYHTPNPVHQLMALREITRELLYLGTLTIPEIPGFEQACVYYPYLDERARRPYAAGYWEKQAPHLLGIGAPIDDTPMRGYGNCWWGISRSALHAMLATARFEVVDEFRTRDTPFGIELVARPIARDPIMPPLSYFRERGEAREKGEPRPRFATYYEDRRKAAGAAGTEITPVE